MIRRFKTEKHQISPVWSDWITATAIFLKSDKSTNDNNLINFIEASIKAAHILSDVPEDLIVNIPSEYDLNYGRDLGILEAGLSMAQQLISPSEGYKGIENAILAHRDSNSKNCMDALKSLSKSLFAECHDTLGSNNQSLQGVTEIKIMRKIDGLIKERNPSRDPH